MPDTLASIHMFIYKFLVNLIELRLFITVPRLNQFLSVSYCVFSIMIEFSGFPGRKDGERGC